MGSQMAVGILGTGSYLPEREVDNAELATMVPGADPEWVSRKTLIEARRFAAPHEATSDLAAKAGAAALAASGLTASEIDYVIVSTSTGDFPQPPTASVVQSLIGADRAASFDINVVCAGFVFALATAHGLIATNPGAKILVIAAVIYSASRPAAAAGRRPPRPSRTAATTSRWMVAASATSWPTTCHRRWLSYWSGPGCTPRTSTTSFRTRPTA
jgi:3-oxoacyl-[acyl-carrier-protein] synthase III